MSKKFKRKFVPLGGPKPVAYCGLHKIQLTENQIKIKCCREKNCKWFWYNKNKAYARKLVFNKILRKEHKRLGRNLTEQEMKKLRSMFDKGELE